MKADKKKKMMKMTSVAGEEGTATGNVSPPSPATPRVRRRRRRALSKEEKNPIVYPPFYHIKSSQFDNPNDYYKVLGVSKDDAVVVVSAATTSSSVLSSATMVRRKKKLMVSSRSQNKKKKNTTLKQQQHSTKKNATSAPSSPSPAFNGQQSQQSLSSSSLPPHSYQRKKRSSTSTATLTSHEEQQQASSSSTTPAGIENRGRQQRHHQQQRQQKAKAEETFDPDLLRKAYRINGRNYYPRNFNNSNNNTTNNNRNHGDGLEDGNEEDDDNTRFILISQAFHTLSNTKTRNIYNRHGIVGVTKYYNHNNNTINQQPPKTLVESLELYTKTFGGGSTTQYNLSNNYNTSNVRHSLCSFADEIHDQLMKKFVMSPPATYSWIRFPIPTIWSKSSPNNHSKGHQIQVTFLTSFRIKYEMNPIMTILETISTILVLITWIVAFILEVSASDDDTTKIELINTIVGGIATFIGLLVMNVSYGMIHYPSFADSSLSSWNNLVEKVLLNPRCSDNEEFELLRDVCCWFYHYCNGYYFRRNIKGKRNKNATKRENKEEGHVTPPRQRQQQKQRRRRCCCFQPIPPFIFWLTLPTNMINHFCIMISEVVTRIVVAPITTLLTRRSIQKKGRQTAPNNKYSKWIGLLLVASLYTITRILFDFTGQTIITVFFLINQLYFNYLLFRKQDSGGLLDMFTSLFFGSLFVITKIDLNILEKYKINFHPQLIGEEAEDGDEARPKDWDVVVNVDNHPGSRIWIELIQDSSTVHKTFNWRKVSRYVDKELKKNDLSKYGDDGKESRRPQRRYLVQEQAQGEPMSGSTGKKKKTKKNTTRDDEAPSSFVWKVASRDEIVTRAKRHFCVAKRYGIATTHSSSRLKSKLTSPPLGGDNDVDEVSSTEDIIDDGGDDTNNSDIDIEMGKA